MEEIKEKLSFAIVVILGIGIMCIAYYILCVKSYVYYTQIDNNQIKSIASSDEMKFEYTLICYNRNGKEKEIQFKTSRELREDAFLELEVFNLFGVHSWKEVSFEELPQKVQEKY